METEKRSLEELQKAKLKLKRTKGLKRTEYIPMNRLVEAINGVKEIWLDALFDASDIEEKLTQIKILRIYERMLIIEQKCANIRHSVNSYHNKFLLDGKRMSALDLNIIRAKARKERQRKLDLIKEIRDQADES